MIKKSVAEKVLKIRKYRLENGTNFIATKLNIKEITARVQWLPLSISNSKVAQFFAEFGKPLNVVHEYCEYEGFTSVCSGIVLQLDSGITKNNIPHIAEICHFPALIVVAGWRPKCLWCNSGGHKFKNCPLRKKKKTFVEATETPEENKDIRNLQVRAEHDQDEIILSLTRMRYKVFQASP